MPRLTDSRAAHDAALVVEAKRQALAMVRADEQDKAVLYARTLRHRAELYRLCADRPTDAVLEVAGAARVGQGRALTQLEHARRAVELYPRSLELLEAGLLLQGSVEMVLWMSAKCSEPVQLELGRRVLDELCTMDAADARRMIAATIVEVEADQDAQAQKDRHQQAQANRGVWVKPVEDGMARIGAEVDQVKAHRFALDLEELVRAEKICDERSGRTRTQAQLRADVLAELPSRHLALLQAFQAGKTLSNLLPALVPTPRRPEDEPTLPGLEEPAHPVWSDLPLDEVAARLAALPVRNPVTMHVHIPVSTVLDLDNRAGYVEGLGPLSAYRARLLRPVASLARLWVDHRTGVPIGLDGTTLPPVGEPNWIDPQQVAAAADEVRRRLLSLLTPAAVRDVAEGGRSPSRALTRFVQVRDVACTGPGCSMPASRCEIDHEQEWAQGGPTAAWNLSLKSPRCHHCRHAGWTAERDPLTGSTTWLSPLGSELTRRSPWRRPPPGPAEDTELPPPALDAPDGDRAPDPCWAGERRFLQAADNRPEPSSAEQPERPRRIPPLPHLPSADVPLHSAWDPPPF